MINRLPKAKAALQDSIDLMVLDFLERGGAITYCPPAVARGAEFSRNQHPKVGIQVPAEA